jgi:hypothetical protein
MMTRPMSPLTEASISSPTLLPVIHATWGPRWVAVVAHGTVARHGAWCWGACWGAGGCHRDRGWCVSPPLVGWRQPRQPQIRASRPAHRRRALTPQVARHTPTPTPPPTHDVAACPTWVYCRVGVTSFSSLVKALFLGGGREGVEWVGCKRHGAHGVCKCAWLCCRLHTGCVSTAPWCSQPPLLQPPHPPTPTHRQLTTPQPGPPARWGPSSG